MGEPDLKRIEAALGDLDADDPGVRLHGRPALAKFLDAPGALHAVARSVLDASCRPVRAILFDKTARNNWSLGWHQDRTIVVKKRKPVEGFGPWSTKQGLQHVAPPFGVLASMATLRLHLDLVTPDNAPLIVALGSHKFGRVPQPEAVAIAGRCEAAICLAERGDVWTYATPILHASEPSRSPLRRRVLQVDYASGDLPGGLDWLGV